MDLRAEKIMPATAIYLALLVIMFIGVGWAMTASWWFSKLAIVTLLAAALTLDGPGRISSWWLAVFVGCLLATVGLFVASNLTG